MKKKQKRKTAVPTAVKQEKMIGKRIIALVLCVLLALGVIAIPILSVLS